MPASGTKKKIPLRLCLGCRCMKPKNELFRIVKSPDGVISFDTTYKAPGRGAYACKNPECFNLMMKTKALSRALKSIIPDEVHNALLNACNALTASDTLILKQDS